MENKLWFKAKRWGWGWYPITWQGWAVTLLYVIAMLQPSVLAEQWFTSTYDIFVGFITPLVINTIFLLIICYTKGEKPRWRWG